MVSPTMTHIPTNKAIIENGIWTCTLSIVDDGPGDWPGSREGKLQIAPISITSPSEWKSFREGEWPWV